MVALMCNATSTANLFLNLPALPQGYKLMGFGMFPAAAQHRACSMHMLLLSFAIATAMLLYWHVLMCSCVFLCCCCCPVAFAAGIGAVGAVVPATPPGAVGAASAHGVAGAWGTLVIGLWGVSDMLDGSTGIGLFNGGGWNQLAIQGIGVAAYGAWAVATSLIVLYVLKATIGLRVSKEDELNGLDMAEHGELAFNSDLNP